MKRFCDKNPVVSCLATIRPESLESVQMKWRNTRGDMQELAVLSLQTTPDNESTSVSRFDPQDHSATRVVFGSEFPALSFAYDGLARVVSPAILPQTLICCFGALCKSVLL